ncbi:hypothetical protein D3C76_1009980 [compost metagenome]
MLHQRSIVCLDRRRQRLGVIALVMTKRSQGQTRFLQRRLLHVTQRNPAQGKGFFRQTEQLDHAAGVGANAAHRHHAQTQRARRGHQHREDDAAIGAGGNHAFQVLVDALLVTAQARCQFGLVEVHYQGDEHRRRGNPRLPTGKLGDLPAALGIAHHHRGNMLSIERSRRLVGRLEDGVKQVVADRSAVETALAAVAGEQLDGRVHVRLIP